MAAMILPVRCVALTASPTTLQRNRTPSSASVRFTVVSPSPIASTVPAGATTGKVQVAMPSSTLSSNVPFRALP